MNYTEILSECRLIAIYLGNTCNFDCNYCDRDYIQQDIGGQNLSKSNLDNIKNFFDQIYKESSLNISLISLHGGEPFLYVKRMDQILNDLQPYLDKYGIRVVITTNGSLLLQNTDFIRKWSKYLNITFSYDFIYQELNRDVVDIFSIGSLFEELSIPVMWQFVMPLTDKKMYSQELIDDILLKSKIINAKSINLIPLRHHRGKSKFQDFFDKIDYDSFINDFNSFVDNLQQHIRVIIDGSENNIDKNYTGKHYKIILSPDGFIYPEYDFVEYKSVDFRVGQWNSNLPNFKPIFYPPNDETLLIKEKCINCSSRSQCGIKFLYKMFDVEPKDSCVTFYRQIKSIINHSIKSQNYFLSTINGRIKFVADSENYKQYFLEEDNLISAKQELIFSMLRRYNCWAGCHVCYVDKYFEKNTSSFSKFIPESISNEMSDRWIKLFTAYPVVSTNDDLYYLKNNHPELFKWYKNHSSMIFFGSITDNAFVRGYDIIINDIDRPKGIYELSFSDVWLSKINIKKIINQLENIQKKSPIQRIKLIITQENSLNSTEIIEIQNFSKYNDIDICYHTDILGTDTMVLGSKDQSFTYASFNGEVYNICSEADYLQYDSFFLTLTDSIDPSIDPYNILDNNFTFTDHLYKHLKGKQNVYDRYRKKLVFSSNEYNQKQTKYYQYIVDNLLPNENYNFIPFLSINKYDKLNLRMVDEGWITTDLGLFRANNQSNIIPLFNFKK